MIKQILILTLLSLNADAGIWRNLTCGPFWVGEDPFQYNDTPVEYLVTAYRREALRAQPTHIKRETLSLLGREIRSRCGLDESTLAMLSEYQYLEGE